VPSKRASRSRNYSPLTSRLDCGGGPRRRATTRRTRILTRSPLPGSVFPANHRPPRAPTPKSKRSWTKKTWTNTTASWGRRGLTHDRFTRRQSLVVTGGSEAPSSPRGARLLEPKWSQAFCLLSRDHVGFIAPDHQPQSRCEPQDPCRCLVHLPGVQSAAQYPVSD